MTLSTGARLGRYEIRSKIGAGGMGEVYLAEDTRLHRKVALKILPTELATNKDRMRRFEQEATAAAALNHPNIAHIYEIGEDKETLFIAMEFVDGETLRAKSRSYKTPLNDLLKYLLQVAEGLAKAHASGIVHRDLKPDNIMITRDGHAKILDFGLAKLIEASGPKADGDDEFSEIATAVMPVQHSTPGVVMGTVGYMSPEQAQAKPVDQRSDIFSFGCLLYEAVTGRKAFRGDSVIDTLHKIIHDPAPAITDFNPTASPGLQRVIRKCLAKEPEKRYQTIRDAANDLEELLAELKGVSDLDRSVAPSTSASQPSTSTEREGTHSVSSPSTSSAEYILTSIKQHKVSISAAGLVLVIVTVAIFGIAKFRNARNSEVAIDSIAVLPFENQNRDPNTEYLSDGVTESIINSLTELPNLKVIARSSVFRYKSKQADPLVAGKELGVRAVLTGRLIQRGDALTISTELIDVSENKQLWGEQYSTKLSDVLSVQRQIASQITSKLRLKLSGAEENRVTKRYTENPDAYQLYLQGRYYWNKRTGDAIKRSVEYYQQAIDRDPNFALAYAGQATAYLLLPAYSVATPNQSFPKAIAAARRAIELDETLADGHTALAGALITDAHNLAESNREYQRAIALNPNDATAHHWYGEVNLMLMGRHDEAIAELKLAIELDPFSLIFNADLAEVYTHARRYDQAIEQLKKTIEMDQNFYVSYWYLGKVYALRGAYPEAIAAYQRARQLNDDPWVLALLGHVAGTSRKKEEALKTAQQLKEISKQRYVPAYGFALVYAGINDLDQAFQWLEQSHRDHESKIVNFLTTDPLLDNVRSDPRYKELVRRVGLPE